MRLSLALLLSAMALPAFSQPMSQPTPNPSQAQPAQLAQPTQPPQMAPIAPSVQPHSSAGGSSIFSPNRAAAAVANAAPMMAGMPPGQSAPGMRPGQPIPSGMPMPNGQNNTASTPAGPEEVPATFVGKFNGVNVYRAGGGYLFNKAARPKQTPKDSGSVANSTAGMAADTSSLSSKTGPKK